MSAMCQKRTFKRSGSLGSFSSHSRLCARRGKRYRVALRNTSYRHFTGCIEHRISNRANVGVDALEVAQHVKMEGCRFQTLRPAFTQAFQMLLRRAKLGVA